MLLCVCLLYSRHSLFSEASPRRYKKFCVGLKYFLRSYVFSVSIKIFINLNKTTANQQLKSLISHNTTMSFRHFIPIFPISDSTYLSTVSLHSIYFCIPLIFPFLSFSFSILSYCLSITRRILFPPIKN